MSTPEPTPDELLAMAYADGELDPDARARFEARLAGEPELARAVALQQRLNVLAREVAPSEPEDLEWARLERSHVRRFGWSLATLLVLLGVAGALGCGVYGFACSEASPLLKLSVGLLAAGFLLWFALVARARARTGPYDPYTEVKR